MNDTSNVIPLRAPSGGTVQIETPEGVVPALTHGASQALLTLLHSARARRLARETERTAS